MTSFIIIMLIIIIMEMYFLQVVFRKRFQFTGTLVFWVSVMLKLRPSLWGSQSITENDNAVFFFLFLKNLTFRSCSFAVGVLFFRPTTSISACLVFSTFVKDTLHTVLSYIRISLEITLLVQKQYFISVRLSYCWHFFVDSAKGGTNYVFSQQA